VRYPVILLSMLLMVQISQLGDDPVWAAPIVSDFSLTFEGALNITEGNTTTWVNETVLIDGNLIVEGTLNVVNSTLILVGNEAHTHVLLNGTLGLTSSSISSQWERTGGRLDGVPSNSTLVNGTGTLILTQNTRVYGLRIEGPGTYVSGSILRDVSLRGSLIRAVGSTLRNTTVYRPADESYFKDCSFTGNGTGTAITVDDNEYLRLDGISVKDHERAIYMEDSMVDLQYSNISDTEIGIECEGESNISLTRVNVTGAELSLNNTGPLLIYRSTFIGCNITRSGGTSLLQSSSFGGGSEVKGLRDGVVKYCLFEGCVRSIAEPRNITIFENTFTGNQVAIDASRSCRIYHNAFLDNTNDVSNTPIMSIWYNEQLKQGNYYSSYDGKDDGSNFRRKGDGIGDSNIPHLGRDFYPLIFPDYWLRPKISPLWLEYTNGSSSVKLTWNHKEGEHHLVERSPSHRFDRSLGVWSSTEEMLTIKSNPNSTLYFRLSTFNGYGSRGYSLPISVKVDQLPLRPGSASASSIPEGEALNVSWEYAGEDIWRAKVSYGETGGNITDFRWIDHPKNWTLISYLDNGVDYTIRISTVDGSGRASRSYVETRSVPSDMVPPDPPSWIDAHPLTNSTVYLSWRPPAQGDVGGYQIFRKGPDEAGFTMIASRTASAISFEDTGLRDNTSYTYAIRTVDDDGPVSEMGPPIEVRTDHINSPPLYSGIMPIAEMEEDGPPYSFDLEDKFVDPDGDRIYLTVEESFPFTCQLIGKVLWIIPEPDQAGEGYVQIRASDLEDSNFYLIGIIVHPTADPPEIRTVNSPRNGSVIMPQSTTFLSVDVVDPDLEQGDRLNITWTSDRDGHLLRTTSISSSGLARLSPGVHQINILVEDSTGNQVSRNISVVVSVWGWEDEPWSGNFVEPQGKITGEGGKVSLRIINEAPLILTYYVRGYLEGAENRTIGDRTMVLSGMSTGVVLVSIPPGIPEGTNVTLRLEVTAETINGTFAGSMDVSTYLFIGSNGEDGGMNPWAMVGIAVSLLIMIGAGAYLFFSLLRRSSGDEDAYQDSGTGA